MPLSPGGGAGTNSQPPERPGTLRDSDDESRDWRASGAALAVAAVAAVTLLAAASTGYAGWLLTDWMRTDLPNRLLLGQNLDDVPVAWLFMAFVYAASAGTAAIGFHAVMRAAWMAFNGFWEAAAAPILSCTVLYAFAAFGRRR